MIPAISYLLAITLAESITVFVHPVWGIACHMGILTLIIVHAALDISYPHRPLLLSLALVPLVRTISLSMPLANIPQIWWYPIIYAPLLMGAIVVTRILHYKRGELGLTVKSFWVQLAVGLTGLFFGVIEYLILRPEPLVARFAWQEIWLPTLILLVCTGFVEEFIFRGVLQHSAVEAFGWRGVIYISLLYAILHMGFFSWINVIFVFVVALAFGWVVKKTGSLLGVILSHGITSVISYLVVPFLLT